MDGAEKDGLKIRKDTPLEIKQVIPFLCVSKNIVAVSLKPYNDLNGNNTGRVVIYISLNGTSWFETIRVFTVQLMADGWDQLVFMPYPQHDSHYILPMKKLLSVNVYKYDGVDWQIYGSTILVIIFFGISNSFQYDNARFHHDCHFRSSYAMD